MPDDEARVADQKDGPDADKGDKGKEPNPLEARVAALEKDLVAKDKRIGELSESERYWNQQAKANAAPKKKDEQPEAEETIIEDGTDATVDAFSARGIGALVERGLMTKKAAKAMFAKESQKLLDEIEGMKRARKGDLADAEMVSKYPELNDDKSPLFERTRQIFQEQVEADPSLKRSSGALMMAARVAKAELKSEGKAEAADSNEADRLSRIKGQSGGNGRRAAESDDDDTLSPGQRKMIDRFNAQGGVQIEEKNYIKRAKEGVQMSARMAMPEAADRREVGDW